jgi:hypothetical protein
MANTIVDLREAVTGGVDTHLDLNVVAAVDGLGGLLGVSEFSADRAGHAQALAWLQSQGRLVKVGVEGTGSYGVGLARHLRGAGVEVVEVDRPNRQSRRRTGKSDPADAIEAARAALSGRAQGAGKTKDGNVEAIRALVVARRSARDTKVKTLSVNGHQDLPTGGHRDSPGTDSRIPQGRPMGRPTDGHEMSPRTAGRGALSHQPSGTTPLPEVASARRTDSPSVTIT